MLTELLKNNKPILQKTDSYLLPCLDKIIDLVTRLEQTAGDDYTNAFERKELPKGTYLLKEGTVCRHLWVLEQGIARVFACHNGVEVNRYFFFPSEMIDSLCSSSLQVPSESSIQLLEDSVVYSILKSQLEELKLAYPLISEIEKIMIECHANWMEKHLYRIQSSCAIKHYRYILEKRPSLIQHVSLHHLSLYLGITPQSLSRIRNLKFEDYVNEPQHLLNGNCKDSVIDFFIKT